MILTLESPYSLTMLLANKSKALHQNLLNLKNIYLQRSPVLNPILLAKVTMIFRKPHILQFVLLHLLSRRDRFLCMIRFINQVFSNRIRASDDFDVYFRYGFGSYGFLDSKKYKRKAFGRTQMEKLN
jgi:hypothetical protein